MRAIKKRLVTYKRADGVDLSFTLYTPPGYVEGTRVPTILYAYPLDFADASKAGQVTGSQATFTRLRQYQLLLLAGYAIIDRASFPIVGDPKKAYDTYLEQLVADAKAAVDEAVRLGVADPDRIGVTGHSHGALMTANLLAHSDLFRAGVATSGSYNKTLTPFGFQNERRSVWEAPDVYPKVSPFFSADKMKLPILIMHGEDDANPGTTPLQSRQAVRGDPRQRRHGAPGDAAARAALVLGDGVAGAADLRDGALVRHVREERAAQGGCAAAASRRARVGRRPTRVRSSRSSERQAAAAKRSRMARGRRLAAAGQPAAGVELRRAQHQRRDQVGRQRQDAAGRRVARQHLVDRLVARQQALCRSPPSGALGHRVARQEHEVRAFGLRGDPFGVASISASTTAWPSVQAVDALGDRAALVVERHEEQRADHAFLVLEVVVDRAHALAAGAAQVVDRRGLDAVGVEQRQRVAQHAAPARLAGVGERALEQPVGAPQPGLPTNSFVPCAFSE